jgi:hypothetical protein
MKVKFTKLAALLLAGAALFATGCTDYEVDIQKVDKKVDELASGRVATLENQLAALEATLKSDYETIAAHKADVDKLNKTISDLEKALTEDLNSAKARIAALEAADENFKQQIKDLQDTDADHAKAIEAINGEIESLKGRVAANEAGLKKLNEEIIPDINKQIKALQDLTAGEWGDQTIKEYVDAVKETLRLLCENYAALTAGFPEDKSLVEYIAEKLDDYVLTETFEKFVAIVGTEEELKEFEGTIIGRLKVAETGIDNLKKELAKITNEEGTGRLDVLEKDAQKLREDVDGILDLVKFADGDLQGYIDGAAQKAFEDACAYADEQIAAAKDELLYYIVDLYNGLMSALQRIQSVVFVPTHDDLKVNMNVSVITQTVEGLDGETEKVGTYIGQPTEVTYKVTPTEYASWLAYYVNGLIGFDEHELDYESDYVLPTGLDKPFAQLLKEYFDYEYPAVFFDTKPLETRADATETEKTPEILICGVTDADDETGEVTFLVYPYGIASPEFVANANKPSYEMDIFDSEGWWCSAATWASGYMDEDYLWGVDDGAYTIGVWKADELKEFMLRKAYATSLTVYVPDHDNYALQVSEGDLYMDDYLLFHNEVSSTYNVLYPLTAEVEILPDPYKPQLDDEGEVVVDEDGYTKVIVAVPERQELPYNALRENATEEEPGFRTVLKDAAPAVSINGGEPMFLPDAEDKYGILLPEFTAEFVKFDIDQYEATSEVNPDNFILTEKVYAEVEMNPDSPASARKLAIGNLITGYYTWTSGIGSINGEGEVLITKELGSVNVDAEAVWTWNYAEGKGDALVDHNLFYETGEEPTVYTRVEWPVHVDEEGAAKLEKDLDITIKDFAGLEPIELTITVADVPEEGAEPVFEELADDAGFFVGNVAIKDGKLYADFNDFEWDKIYKIVAVYDLPYAKITVNGTFTTTDRNREMVTIDKYEYTFDINKFDEKTGFGYIAGADNAAGYYYWKSEPMHKAIFKVFDEEGVINVLDNVDFEFDADQADFNEGELDTHIRAYNEEPGPGTAWKYVDINRNGIYGETKSADSQISAKDLKELSTGEQDPNDPYVFLGKVIYRYITTYIGEVVEIPFQFNYRVPAYDFLHQTNYTFDDGKWYTMASPKYDPNKTTLAKYDVNYMNVPALAFNIIDENKRFFNYLDELEADDPTYFYDENLYINFYYTGPDPVDETVLEDQSTTDEIKTYGDLWFNATDKGEEYSVEEADNFEHTVFYYRSIRDAIPMYGTLEIESDGVRFEIPTSFEKDNGGKYIAAQDYSNYELRAWKPFYVPTYEQTVYVDLNEHTFYNANVLEGLQFFDARQVAASTPVDAVKDPFVEGTYSIEGFNYGTKAYFRPMLGFNDDVWGWVIGNEKNGYVQGVSSWDAYDLQMKNFVFDDRTGVPQDLRRLISVDEENYVMTFDYNSQIEFMGTAEIDFSFDFQTPWQKFEKPFSVKVIIRGLDQQ